MAVLGRLLMSSSQRLDLPDFLAIDSYGAGDWKYFLKGLIGTDRPYILKGFDVIDPDQSIGSTNVSIKVADSAVFYPESSAGAFFYGLEEGNILAQPLIPELKKNATNFVYLTLDTIDAGQDTRSFWDTDKEGGEGGEFSQDVNTESTLVANINVSVSSFPQNTIPICKVVVAADFIESIEDSRDMLFRLAPGGMTASPYGRYEFKELPEPEYARSEPSPVITNPLNPNPFQGGDKNIYSLKEWMDVVMTKLAELGGTTFWYEDTNTFNMVNIFADALATSIRSKGQWQHSTATAGKIIWTEDIISQSLQDNRDYIIRSGEQTLQNDDLMYVKLERDLAPNDYGYILSWFNSVNHVNGQVGSFSNLKKGDWIKKKDDEINRFLRVEEFYLLANKGGGVTAPSNAQSVKLSEVYGGTSGSIEGAYCKGIYESGDLKVQNRANVDILNSGGDLFWLAFRSDTEMALTDVTSTALSIEISQQDGIKARCTCLNNSQTGLTAHLLSDGERITINGSTNYDGTYSVEKINDQVFYIYTDKEIDEVVSGYYGIATTTARYTDDGLLLETANHNFETDQLITIADTATSWDGEYLIYERSDTKFSFPISSSISSTNDGLAILAKLNVRTEVSQAKITQGEVKYVGEVDTENIQDFIGMKSITQTSPDYQLPGDYNTLHASMNYNGNTTDNLTVRVSKLTAMMADKAQDKTIKFAPDYNICTKTTNGADQEIEFVRDGGSPILSAIACSSTGTTTVGLDGTLVLGENKAAFFSIDRNAPSTVADLSGLTVADITDVPLTENVFILAYRLNTDSVWLWDQVELAEGNNIPSHVINDIINDNAYDEPLSIIAGAPSNTNEFQGPVTAFTTMPLPLDSRDGNDIQGYTVGRGVLEITLNGITLKHGVDWSETGVAGAVSTTFRINIDLVVGDELQLRIDTFGGYVTSTGGSGGSGEANYGTNIGGYNELYKLKLLDALQFRTIKAGAGITVQQQADYLEISGGSGAALNVVTVTADHLATMSDDIILVDAAAGDVRINLGAAASNSGAKLDIKKIDASVNNMIIDANGSETIDGLLTQSTGVQYESLTIVCDGTAWFLI